MNKLWLTATIGHGWLVSLYHRTMQRPSRLRYELKALITEAVEHNTRLSQIERVRRFVIAIEPFSTENSQLAPTLKVRRHVVRSAYADSWTLQTPPTKKYTNDLFNPCGTAFRSQIITHHFAESFGKILMRCPVFL